MSPAAPLDESISDRYAHDECAAFAVALHALTGRPTVMFTIADGADQDEFVHAAVALDGEDEGKYLDAYGVPVSLDELSDRYGTNLQADVVDVGMLELLSGRDPADEDTQDALAHAEHLLQLMSANQVDAPAARATHPLRPRI